MYHLESHHAREFAFCEWWWAVCGVPERIIGTNHCDDLVFLFKQAFDRRPNETYKCWKAFNFYLNSITAFARDGNPGWEMFKGNGKCVNIKADSWTVDAIPYAKEMQVWDSLDEVAADLGASGP